MIITIYKHKHSLFSPTNPSETPVTHTMQITAKEQLRIKKKKKESWGRRY